MLTDTLTPASLAHSHFDRLMVRVLMPLFAAGSLAVILLWWLETSEGKISEVNRWAYPLMLLVFGGCLGASGGRGAGRRLAERFGLVGAGLRHSG